MCAKEDVARKRKFYFFEEFHFSPKIFFVLSAYFLTRKNILIKFYLID